MFSSEAFKTVLNHDNWPEFRRPEFLDELNRIADEAFKKETIDGYLASVLIYQQLTEEIIQLLVEYNNLFVRASVLPLNIRLKELGDETLGKKIEAMKFCIDFDNKEEFVRSVTEFNKIRNKLVHKLTRKNSLEEIEELSKQAKKHFDNSFDNFESYLEHMRQCLHDKSKEFQEAITDAVIDGRYEGKE